MDRSENGPLKIREPYDPMFRAMFLVSAARTVKLIGGTDQYVGSSDGSVNDESHKRWL